MSQGKRATVTFAEPGRHWWTCPAGVTSVDVEATGGTSGDGTPGAVIWEMLEVTPGTTYEVTVGAAGRGGLPSSAGGAAAGSAMLGSGGGGGGVGGSSATTGNPVTIHAGTSGRVVLTYDAG